MSGSTQFEIVAAAAVAALTIDVLVYPLDTIKTRLQSQDYAKTFAAAPKSCRGTSGPVYRGLYQGVGSALVAMVPSCWYLGRGNVHRASLTWSLVTAVVFFTTYESAKSVLGNAAKSYGLPVPQPAAHAAASGVAELASCIMLAPAEVVKQNAQMLRSSPAGGAGPSASTSMEALRVLWRGDGRRGGAGRRLWSGYTALASRNLPFTALQFPLFEMFRGRLWAWRHGRAKKRNRGTAAEGISASMLAETGLVTGLSAALSGSIAAVITTPTDVVKTRTMLGAGRAGKSDGPTQQVEASGKIGGFNVAKQVFRDGGIRGFFRGALLRAAWTAIGSGLYLGTYEVAKLWLRHGSDGDEDDL